MRDSYGKPREWYRLLPDEKLDISEENFNLFFELMFERQEIWYKRFVLKQKAPWTDNEIFKEYKFTNVYRELDRASQWMIKNILLNKSLSKEDVIWQIISFRFFNQPDTFEKREKYHVNLQSWKGFNAQKMWEQVVTVRDEGKRNPFHVAYMQNLAFLAMPAGGPWRDRGLFKDHAYIRYAYPAIHKLIPSLIKIIEKNKPEDIIEKLKEFPATADFQAYEFYLDFCYLAKYAEPIMKCDENTYVNIGPGCDLGLRLIFPSSKTKEEKLNALNILYELSEETLNKIGEFKYIKWDKHEQDYCLTNYSTLTKHNIEFCLCEFQKYWKMTIKEGKQRSKFLPKSV